MPIGLTESSITLCVLCQYLSLLLILKEDATCQICFSFFKKTCYSVNVFVSRKPAALQCGEQVMTELLFVSRKVEKILKFPSFEVCWTGSLGNLSFVKAFCQKKNVRFSFGCLDALGQTRKQQGKSTVNVRVLWEELLLSLQLLSQRLENWNYFL